MKSTTKFRKQDPKRCFFLRVYSISGRYTGWKPDGLLRSGNAEYMLLLTIKINEQGNCRKTLSGYSITGRDPVQNSSKLLTRHLRMGDVAARYSDEQYIVMLPYCDYESSQKVA